MMRATVVLACLMGAGAQVAGAQAVPRAISGRVFDDTTGCPLAGVQIEAVGTTGRALTNVQGRYRLVNPPDGQFVLQAVHAGYQSHQTLPMTVTDSSARVDFSLVRATGDGSGRVAYPRKSCQLEPPDTGPQSGP